MTALELLKQDHQEALGLIDSLELTEDELDEDSETDSEAFPRLQAALKLHTQLEEEVFYPALEQFNETREIVKEAYREHEQVDELLAQLAALTPTQEEFQGTLAELRDSLEQHIEEEEGEMFPKAEELCGPQKRWAAKWKPSNAGRKQVRRLQPNNVKRLLTPDKGMGPKEYFSFSLS